MPNPNDGNKKNVLFLLNLLTFFHSLNLELISLVHVIFKKMVSFIRPKVSYEIKINIFKK